jgi:hypothetical protein
MAGLVPAIHAFATPQDVDARVKPAHDGAKNAARSRHSGSHPQCAARRRERDGGRSAAHVLQHDDLRGARLLHGPGEHAGRTGRAECGRRLAFRRRPRRHHHRRHEALRHERLCAGRCHHHQSPGGCWSASQQRRHLHAVFLPRRAPDVRHGAGTLDRRGRHEHGFRRRAHRG